MRFLFQLFLPFLLILYSSLKPGFSTTVNEQKWANQSIISKRSASDSPEGNAESITSPIDNLSFDDVNSQLKSAEQNATKYQQEITDAEKDLAQKEKEAEEPLKEFETIRQKWEKLKELKDLKDEAKNARDALVDAQDAFSNANSTMNDAEGEVRTAEDDIKEQEQHIADLKNNTKLLEEATANQTKLTGDISSLKNSVNSLKNAKNSRFSDLGTAQGTVDSFQAKYDSSKCGDKTKAKSDCGTTETKLKDAKTALETAQKNYNESLEAYNNADSNLADLRKWKDDVDSQVTKLEGYKKNLAIHQTFADAELETRRQNKDNKENLLVQPRAELKTAQETLDAADKRKKEADEKLQAFPGQTDDDDNAYLVANADYLLALPGKTKLDDDLERMRSHLKELQLFLLKTNERVGALKRRKEALEPKTSETPWWAIVLFPLVVVIAICGIVGYLCWRRRKSDKKEGMKAPAPSDPGNSAQAVVQTPNEPATASVPAPVPSATEQPLCKPEGSPEGVAPPPATAAPAVAPTAAKADALAEEDPIIPRVASASEITPEVAKLRYDILHKMIMARREHDYLGINELPAETERDKARKLVVQEKLMPGKKVYVNKSNKTWVFFTNVVGECMRLFVKGEDSSAHDWVHIMCFEENDENKPWLKDENGRANHAEFEGQISTMYFLLGKEWNRLTKEERREAYLAHKALVSGGTTPTAATPNPRDGAAGGACEEVQPPSDPPPIPTQRKKPSLRERFKNPFSRKPKQEQESSGTLKKDDSRLSESRGKDNKKSDKSDGSVKSDSRKTTSVRKEKKGQRDEEDEEEKGKKKSEREWNMTSAEERSLRKRESFLRTKHKKKKEEPKPAKPAPRFDIDQAKQDLEDMEKTVMSREDMFKFIEDLLKAIKDGANEIKIDVGKMAYIVSTAVGKLGIELFFKVFGPSIMVGDLHGNADTLNRVLDAVGGIRSAEFKKRKIIFLGDYVDRGKWSLEVILIACVLKCLFPENIYLIRGNHETISVCAVYGFLRSLKIKFGEVDGLKWFNIFNYLFVQLPLAGKSIASKKLLCMHGGIPDKNIDFEEFNKIDRNDILDAADDELACSAVWADPAHCVDRFAPGGRGGSTAQSFGLGAISDCCTKNGVDALVRAHQVVVNGYEPFGKQCITVFTATSYAMDIDLRNNGSILLNTANNGMRVVSFVSSELRDSRHMLYYFLNLFNTGIDGPEGLPKMEDEAVTLRENPATKHDAPRKKKNKHLKRKA